MEQTLQRLRHWGSPSAAIIFFVLWSGRHWGLYGSFLAEQGRLPAIVLVSVAIALAGRWAAASLGVTALLLVLQLLHVLEPMIATPWQLYIGAFVALAFMLWLAPPRMRIVAGAATAALAGVMAFIMLGRGYGMGAYWASALVIANGTRTTMIGLWWQCWAVLLLIAAGCAAAGVLLRLYEERGTLFRARDDARASLKETEVELIVEQERTRITRDLHDVLAHSLAVIAAQADGARYLGHGQPQAVLNALETIAGSARRALVDAQRVIENVRDDGTASPQPLLRDIGPLVEQMRGSLKIQQSSTGKPVELGAGQQLAVFRIIQECLTNALKHGGRGTAVRVHSDWSGPGLTLHAASTLRPLTAAQGHADGANAGRVGRGIPGMRERAHLAGGWLTAGSDGEDFRVTAFIPYGIGRADTAPALAEAAGADGAARALERASPPSAGASPSLAGEPGGMKADARG
ncbi:sensor histidine kinase [Pseudarthrobacter albicanus]|uniref:sensor histidine kinase n=1 Tax=Pseudarthrobacter albicanus TaxID=2823873 RepID=UPI001BABFBC9|nr:histidine kinase [Pseudarthrobacter albicanus]